MARPCVTMGSHSFTYHPHTNHNLYSQPQGVTTFWLVHIAPTQDGIARLSWPRWLVTYWDKCSAPEIEPGHGHHPSTNRAWSRVTSLIGATPLTVRHRHHFSAPTWKWHHANECTPAAKSWLRLWPDACERIVARPPCLFTLLIAFLSSSTFQLSSLYVRSFTGKRKECESNV